MKERFERLNSYEMRTAMLFAWGFVIGSCAFVISINWHGMDFAPFPIAFFCIISLFEFVRYFYMAYYATYSETDAEEIAPSEEIAQPIAQRFAPPNESDIKDRVRFYAFVHSVVVNGMLSETAWQGKDLTMQQVRKWFALLEEMGVTSKVTQGQRRQALVSWEDALDIIERASGESGYWNCAKQYYNALTRPSSVLVIP